MLTKNDKKLIFGLIVLSLILFLFGKKVEKGKFAIIKIGRLEKKISLLEEKKFEIKGKKGKILIEIRNEKIRVLESSCPQKICVNTGWINKKGQSIICIPNQVFVAVEGKREVDGVTY